MKSTYRMMWAAAGMAAIAFSGEVEAAEDTSILGGRAPQATALAEFEQLICPLDTGGGMLTAIVNAALAHGGADEGFSIKVDTAKNARETIAKAGEATRGITFPWYKPKCDRPSYLTEHTRRLCSDAAWSEPIFEMFIGYFTRADYERPLTASWHLMGATICVSGNEFPNLLKERGVSENNAKIVVADKPGACFDAVILGAADIAVLPDSVADQALREKGMVDAILRHPGMDEMVTLHAVAQKGDEEGAATLAILDKGMNEIRESGEWFEIVANYLAGHDHSGGHEHVAHNHASAEQTLTASVD